MSIAAIVRANLSQFADFRGRSSREEFWCFFLVGVLAAQSMSLLTGSLSSIFPAFGSSMLASPPFMVRGLLLLPFLAAAARRLRDCGKSPWWRAWPCRASYWRAGSWRPSWWRTMPLADR